MEKLAVSVLVALSLLAFFSSAEADVRRVPLATGEVRRGPLATQFSSSLKLHVDTSAVDPGLPLFLTSYIKANRSDLARELSLVGPLQGTKVVSYSGFFTVNETYNSNMFFWFVPATKVAPAKAPVVLWLQGGPGGPSVYGLLVENGPFMINSKIQLVDRKVAWSNEFNMLYIDNPVGTGFSFTDNDIAYAKNEDDVARDLYSALTQFYKVFSQYRGNEFYVTGESYAGKYVPAISYEIHTMNKKLPQAERINYKGMAIGDGLCDPINMLGYGELLYQVGYLDENQRDQFITYATLIKSHIIAGSYVQAFKVFDELLNGDLYPYGSFFKNYTGSTNYFNILYSAEPTDTSYWAPWIQLNEVRRALHVGKLTFHVDNKVEQMLLADIMKTMTHKIVPLLEANYKVMFYNGNLDVIVGTPLTENFLWWLSWNRQKEYRNATRSVWKVEASDVEVAGYTRRAGNMTQVIVRNSGHMVPYDQPVRALDMMRRYVAGTPLPWN